MPNPLDYYACLDIPRSASVEEIRAAFRKTARRFHPDVNPDLHAAEEFKLISTAHEILSNASKREEYDRQIAALDTPFSIKVTYSRPALKPTADPQVVYCLLDIHAVAQSQRLAPRLNLCLVVDRSTSMQGQRLDHVKSAARQIIENLDAEDYFSIVSFSDRAEIVSPTQLCHHKPSIMSKVNSIQAGGGTEILQGLMLGLLELQKNFKPQCVNHLTLLTDGRTYGDEDDCLLLSTLAEIDGIIISGLGIGNEWNDTFLDQLTNITGGESSYIHSADKVEDMLVNQVRGIGGTMAQRLRLQITCDPDIKLRSAFRLHPEAFPIAVEEQPLRLGSIPHHGTASILLEFVVKTSEDAKQSIARLSVVGDILGMGRIDETVITDLAIKVSGTATNSPPPTPILNALDKLTLYRLQEKAWAAAEAGKVQEASQHLEMLASRLLTAGEANLAKTAVEVAHRLGNTRQIPGEAKKQIKYGTRAFISKI